MVRSYLSATSEQVVHEQSTRLLRCVWVWWLRLYLAIGNYIISCILSTMCEHQRIQTCLPDSTTLKNVSTVASTLEQKWREIILNPCNIYLCTSWQLHRFCLQLHQQLFSASSSAFLLRTHGTVLCVLMGVCRTNLRMRSWGICQRLSRKYVQKKNSPGLVPLLRHLQVRWHVQAIDRDVIYVL